ncbi:MAG: HAD-IA family hydrolase [Gammaproteobacteria bacterium]
MQALIFDCDGVLVDTERDGHRVAFNRAFAVQGLNRKWSIERYGELLTTAGGKERMRRDFDETGWPVPVNERDRLITDLHRLKTDLFMDLIESGELPLRTGVARLIDEAIDADIELAVCSTSNERAVQAVVDVMLGPGRARHIAVFAGDIVSAKKPDPAIYQLAVERLGLDHRRCAVIEDSNNGLRAAVGAGMHCVITTSFYTGKEDFTGADLVVPELGDGPPVSVRLADLQALCSE